MARSRRALGGPPAVMSTPRDYVMARLAAARSAAAEAINLIDDWVALFVDPESDKKLVKRDELAKSVLEQLGCATWAVEDGVGAMPAVDPLECEPWDADEE